MNGYHSAERPDCDLQSGRATYTRPAAMAASFANDNRARPVIGQVAAVVLCLEFTGTIPLAAIRARLSDGTMVPLATSRDPDDFIALWRGLGRDLNAALEVLDKSGSLRSLTLAPGARWFGRWRGSNVARRRTRFSRKRLPPLAAHATTSAGIEESA